MADDLAPVEFFVAEQHSEEGTFAGAIPTDEADFRVVGDRGLGAVEQDLIAVAFERVADLQEYAHE